MTADKTLVERLRAACDGHPHAKIPWPHRVLHEAADRIEADAARITMLDAVATHERERADKLEAALREIANYAPDKYYVDRAKRALEQADG